MESCSNDNRHYISRIRYRGIYYQLSSRQLFNNAYTWASQEERKEMDENKECKKPHYRQSGFTFVFTGFSFFMYASYIATEWIRLYVTFWVLVLIAAVYAAISSIQNERHK